MKSALFFIVILLPAFVFSQLSHEWTSPFTGSGQVIVDDVDHDSDGNSYIIGHLNGTADFDPGFGTAIRTSQGNIDMFLAKYDINGNFVWVNVFLTQFSGWGVMSFQLKVALNSIYVGGTFIGTTDFDPGPGTQTLTSMGNLGPCFGRYDLNGNYLWMKTAGTLNNDHITGLDVDAAGNLYLSFVAGGTSPDFDPGPGVATVPINWNDGVFAKYDPMGNFIFAKGIASTSGNWHPCMDIVVDNANEIYVIGVFDSSVDIDPNGGTVVLNPSGVDAYIAKYSATGNYLWHGQYAGNGTEVAACLKLDTDNGMIYVGGSFGSTTVDVDFGPGTNTLSVSGAENGFIAKYTTGGAFQWAVNMNGNVAEAVSGIDLDRCGNVCATGISSSNSLDVDPSINNTAFPGAGEYDFFLAKYTPSGMYMQGFRIGGPGYDIASAVSVNQVNGSISLCGNFGGNVDFDPGAGAVTPTAGGPDNGFLSNYSEAPPTPSNLTPSGNLAICPGDSTTLIVSGSAMGTVYWYDNLGNIIGSGDTLYTGAISSTPVVFYFKDSLSCLGSSDLDSIIVGNGIIDVAIAATDTIICAGSSATLTASGATSYTWSPGSSSNPVITISPGAATTYTVVGQSGACIDSAQVTINVLPPPDVSIQGDSMLCSGESTTLIASGASSFTWNPGGFVNDTITVFPTSTTVYTLIGQVGQSAACKDTAQITVTVSPMPVVNAEGMDTICPGGSAVLAAQGAITYTWTPNVSFVLPDGSRVLASPLVTTVYTVTGVDATGMCSATDQVTVTVVDHIPMDLTAGPNPVIAEYPLVMFHGEPSDELLVWHFGDGTSAEGATVNHLFPENVEGTYQVMLIASTAGGCIDTLFVDIIVQAGGLYYVPNAFTPNGDGYNNVFKPVFSLGFDAKKYNLSIFNRWGELVFGTDSFDEGWDGMFAGKPCPDGIYTWKITTGTDKTAEVEEITGFVTLLR